MLKILSAESSVVNQYLRELRDVGLQKDRARFERNIERLAAIAGYELSKRLEYKAVTTVTPLAKAKTPVIKDDLVIGTVLRAGLPVQNGLHKVFDQAELAFVAAGRKPDTEHGVEIELAYAATPSLGGKVLIMADTMLATGKSMVDAVRELQKHGRPSRLFIVAVIASQPGVDYVQMHLPNAELIVCALDPELNKDYFIVPGLGDAGDLLYGSKN